MAEVVVLEFSAPGAGDIYMRVNGILGWGGVPGPGVRPDGLISSISGGTDDKLIVVESWASKAHQEKFLHDQLGPALAQAEVAQPSRVEWFDGIIDFHLE